ncbi:MAG TPA: hypothetical protein VFB21_22400 [Chthonomonadaceae bacterium]|nr:hypothetical protein [Chthonomonadaceae bacterium]
MNGDEVVRDERTIFIENASYRWAYLFLSFGLLGIVAYRSFSERQSNWDMLILVIAGGLVTTLYQAVHRVLTRRWLWTAIATFLVAVAVAILIALNLK